MRLRRALPLLVLLAVTPPGVLPGEVAAQTSNPDRSRELQQQILEAGEEQAAALRELQDIRTRKGLIDARVAELDTQLQQAQAKLAPLQAEADRLAAQYGALVQELAQRQAELDAAKTEFDASAGELYRSARRGATYDLVTAMRPQDLVQANKYMDIVSEKRRLIVARITELRDALEAKRKELADVKAKADAAAAGAQAERDKIAALRAEVEPARAQAAQEERNEQAQLDAIRAKKADYEREYAALQATSDSLAAYLRGRGSSPGAVGACQFRPVPGAIVSGFGPRTDPISGASGFHPGVDMNASYGTPIKACRGGTVVIAGWQGGYGNAVIIDHGGGMATLYGHQSRIGVSVGQQVGAGDVIGFVGSTGYSTGPHLHFEVRMSGNPVNPVGYL